MNDPADTPNPTEIKLTHDQLDESFRQRYWSNAIRYGIQYYVAGRFATASGFTPVSANLLHHAAELLLKACLAYDDPVVIIRQYGDCKKGYRHNLLRLWTEFNKRHASLARPEFDTVIGALHKFEDIRYPEKLIENGATISIGLFEVENPISGDGIDPNTLYVLMLPQVDRLMNILFEASHGNPVVFLGEVNDERRRLYYDKLATTLFGRTPTDE